MVYRSQPALRPEDVWESCGPRFGEYPVKLVTRRTWGLRAQSLIDRRAAAPNSIWLDARSQPDAWKNFGES